MEGQFWVLIEEVCWTSQANSTRKQDHAPTLEDQSDSSVYALISTSSEGSRMHEFDLCFLSGWMLRLRVAARTKTVSG